MMKPDNMTDTELAALTKFVEGHGIDDSHRNLVGAIFRMWETMVNDVIQEAEARGYTSIVEYIREEIVGYGFRLTSDGMVDADTGNNKFTGEGVH